MLIDVIVEEDGAEIWRWSAERMFTQAVQTETIPPGGSFTQTRTWDDPNPGEYATSALLEAKNVSLVERASFEVS